MIQRIDVNKRIDFVCPSDTSEPKTVFVLRPLSSSEIMNDASNDKEKISKAMDMLEKSIVEVRNGGEYKSKRELIDTLPMDIIGDLSNKVTELNHLTKELAKNS